jgi:hypothetical protein
MTSQPSCFGKSWDPTEKECAGGLDPVYTNPKTQTHHRERCNWFEPCRQHTENRPAPAQPAPQVIPPQSLLQSRPPVAPPRPLLPPVTPTYTPPRPPPQPPTQQVPFTQFNQPQPQPTAPQYYVHHPQNPGVANYPILVPPVVAQYGPQFVSPPYQVPGSPMPYYLTVPEPVRDDVPWSHRLAHELARSALKGMAHTAASFFDFNPFRRYDK